MSYAQGAAELRGLIERVEAIEERIAEEQGFRREVYAEAKALGFDVPTMKVVVRRRKLTPDQRAEADILTETYEEALSGWNPRIVDGGVIEGGQLVLSAPAAALPKGKDAGRLAAWLEGGMQ